MTDEWHLLQLAGQGSQLNKLIGHAFDKLDAYESDAFSVEVSMMMQVSCGVMCVDCSRKI